MPSSVKIKSIKKISTSGTPVYDISVPKYNNFVLGNGLVVHNCKPYQYLRSAIYEQRMRLFKTCNLLTKEALELERNGNTGKIDHPDNKDASKDSIDAICGATFEASKYAEQYAFDYGDDLEASVDANMADYDEDKKQITLDFEEELKKAFKTTPAVQKSAKDLDFGFGPSVPMVDDSSVLISQGLMIW